MIAAPTNADGSEASILHLVKQVQYQAFLRLEDVFGPLGITAVQFRILTTLSALPTTSSAELARLYGVKPQTMIKQVAMLESKGMIERTASAANKRRLELRLTGQGEKILHECRDGSAAVERQILETLSDEQEKQLASLLTRLLAAMGARTERGDAQEFSPEAGRAGVQRG